ncbi:MAG TPA: glycosyltransferase [Burkholderiaceae bacterium]
MLQAPRTTVVIPAYNHERFIGEALASLQAQTLADFEVVVVDDGSSDGTAAVAQAVAREDQRIRVVAQANRGSHAAINRGVAEARGRWVSVLNSDDRYAPTRLERLHQAADAGARFVVTDARLIDDAGREIADPEHWWNRAMADFHARVSEYGPVEGLMYGNFTVSTSNFFFERSLAEEIGPLRPLRRVLDWDWALRAALHAPSAFRYLGGERLFDYRLHGRNAILAGPLRGTLEIHRVQREALRSLGIPRALLASMQRNRRELRRAWRDLGVARVEGFVREREADLETLHREHAQMRNEHAQMASTITALRARLDSIEQSLPWRALAALKRIVRPGDR